jgi:hypothetical protein
MKKSAVTGLVLASAAAWFLGDHRKSPVANRLLSAVPGRQQAEARRIADQSSQRYLMYFIVPGWALAAGLDYLWHRQTKIETTSGPKESITHLLMMGEAGIPLLAGLFLESNAGLLALMTAGMLLHQATVIWDVEYTASRRKIPPREQHTHTFMETLPFDILAVFATLHPEQFRSMLGLGREKPDFSLRLKKPGLPIRQIVGIFGAITLFVALPHVEEFWRCWRAYRRGLTGKDTPECVRELYAA